MQPKVDMYFNFSKIINGTCKRGLYCLYKEFEEINYIPSVGDCIDLPITFDNKEQHIQIYVTKRKFVLDKGKDGNINRIAIHCEMPGYKPPSEKCVPLTIEDEFEYIKDGWKLLEL